MKIKRVCQVPNTYKALERTAAQPVSIRSKQEISKNDLKRLAAIANEDRKEVNDGTKGLAHLWRRVFAPLSGRKHFCADAVAGL